MTNGRRNKLWRSIGLCALCAVALAACQPNPEKPPVVGKDNLREELEQQTVESQQPVEEADWEDHLQVGLLEVNIQAKIEAPETDTYAVAELKPTKFTDEQVQRFIKTFYGEGPYYSGDNIPSTKEYFMRDILGYRQYYAERNIPLSEDDEYLQELYQWYEEAPTDEEVKQNLKQVTDFSWENSSALKGAKTISLIDQDLVTRIDGFSDSQESSLEYQDLKTTYRDMIDLTKQVEGLTITLEDSEAKAKEAVKELGIEDMGVTGRYLYQDYFDRTRYAYMFVFTRELNGIPFTYALSDNSMLEIEGQQTNKPIPAEKITVMVDNTGVSELIWENPYEIGEIVSENVQLMSVEEIQEIFLNYMEKYWEKEREYVTKKDQINVERMTLGYMVMRDQDRSDNYICVPVWDFFASRKETGNDDHVTIQENDYSILTLNAVNGAVINRKHGY